MLSNNRKYLMFGKMNNCYVGLWFWLCLVEVNLTLLSACVTVLYSQCQDLVAKLRLNKIYNLKERTDLVPEM
jgi:hypothetical protein